MIRHIVHLRFRKDVTAKYKNQLFEELFDLRNHIEGILDFQMHKNISLETNLVRGFRDMFWFDFTDEEVRDRYLEDPTHQTIGKRITEATEGGLDGIFVSDIKLDG